MPAEAGGGGRGHIWLWTPPPHAPRIPHPCQQHALTNLLFLVLGLEAHDLQVAAVGDIGHDSSHTAPHAQQRPAKHVVVPQPLALLAVLAFLYQAALPIPAARRNAATRTPWHPQAPRPSPLSWLSAFLGAPGTPSGVLTTPCDCSAPGRRRKCSPNAPEPPLLSPGTDGGHADWPPARPAPPPAPSPATSAHLAEAAAQAVPGLRLALAPDVGLVHGEVLAAALLGQEAAGLVSSHLLGRGRVGDQGLGAQPRSLWVSPKGVRPWTARPPTL